MEHKEQIEKILAAHNAVESFIGKAIEAAITAGELLASVKVTMPKKFTAWLKTNIKDISPETARRYMRLAKRSHKTDLTQCTSLRQAYLKTGILKAASPKKASTTGNGSKGKDAKQSSTGTTANGATQTPAGDTGFSPAMKSAGHTEFRLGKPALSELVASIMEHLNGITDDHEIKMATFALTPCGEWYVKQSMRLIEAEMGQAA